MYKGSLEYYIHMFVCVCIYVYMHACMHGWMDGWMCVCVLQPYHADRCWLFLILAMLLIYLRDSFRGVGGSGAEPPLYIYIHLYVCI